MTLEEQIDRLIQQGLEWKERAEMAERQRGELYGHVAQLTSDLVAARAALPTPSVQK